MKTHPSLPSELVVNEAAYKQYKEWMRDRKDKCVCIVAGEPGIGKETMVRLCNRIFNYQERYIDGTDSREEIVHKIDEVKRVSRDKDISGRKLIIIARDLDQYIFQKLCEIKGSRVPIVIICDERFRKTWEGVHIEGVSCYSDGYRVMKRVAHIARREKIDVPEEIRIRIEGGEKIRKALSDLQLYKASRNVKGAGSTLSGSVGPLDLLKKLLYGRGDKRKRYAEIERMCRANGVKRAIDLVFENGIGKAVTLDGFFSLINSISYADGCSRQLGVSYWVSENLYILSLYMHHQMLYNDLVISFKVSARERKEPENRQMLYMGVPRKRWFMEKILVSLKDQILLVVKKISSSSSKADKKTREYIKGFLEGIRGLNMCTKEEIAQMETVHALETFEKTSCMASKYTPRYVYKEGHSNYVTREITIREILGER
ncbi:hypothetical protein NEFER03_0313 [Nematocida sp. LUAm3]|nr:hypothetical protein NEFER03_0313 [Nematocida sp. LUAm3]KAI5173765.1 hypothetical protein NEFER02_0281 [Nematocida sp. LUAm2]KAI5176988.1 hypothetical protein NEFER01_0313 [Nematocida sp. LUAm1]